MRKPEAALSVSLSDLAGAALEERFQAVIAQVLENLMDPNTNHKKARKVTVVFSLKANEARQFINLDIDVVPAFAPLETLRSGLLLKTDGSGFTIAAELVQEELPLQDNVTTFKKGN